MTQLKLYRKILLRIGMFYQDPNPASESLNFITIRLAPKYISELAAGYKTLELGNEICKAFLPVVFMFLNKG